MTSAEVDLDSTRSKAWRVSLWALGIGDILCALYGLNAFSIAHRRPAIELHLPDHLDWASLVDLPGLTVVKAKQPGGEGFDFVLGDDEAGYQRKLRGNHSPKHWYATKLGVVPVRPEPRADLLRLAPPPFKRPYVVLAPFASKLNRSWDIYGWRIVARDLIAAGYEVIALDAAGQPERCKPIGVRYFWGQPAAWVANTCRHAALVISCDSALAHLGGWLGVPTLVVMSQLDPASFYAMTANRFVLPGPQPCAGCRFQPERGYEERCDYGCWVLQSISPRAAGAAALEMLGARRDGMNQS